VERARRFAEKNATAGVLARRVECISVIKEYPDSWLSAYARTLKPFRYPRANGSMVGVAIPSLAEGTRLLRDLIPPPRPLDEAITRDSIAAVE
jgi:hypothetical protein